MASPNDVISAKLDELQKAINDVVVQVSKGIKDSMKDSRGVQTTAGNSLATKFQSATVDFNCALDDLEREIIQARSVLLRDLGELRAKRMPPPVVAPQPKPVAPPAPMTIETESPVLDSASLSGPAAAPPPAFPGAGRAIKQESKPVAPLPDMGFDLTLSPEVRPAPSPALSQAKVKQVKSSPKSSPKQPAAQSAATTGRPASVPPRKEPKATAQSQTSRTAGSTPQPPAPPQSAPVAPPAPMMVGPLTVPSSVTPGAAPAAPAPPQDPAPQPEMVFTDMTFSLAPAANEPAHGGTQTQTQSLPSQQHASDNSMVDMTQFGAPADMSGNLLNMANFDTGVMDLTAGGNNNNNNSISQNSNAQFGNSDNNNAADDDMLNVDAEIENLLNSAGPDPVGPDSAEKMEMDYELGGIGLENNSFNDMFFDTADGGDEDFGQDSYYGI